MDQRKVSMGGFARLLGAEPLVVTSYFRADYDPKLSTVFRWCEVLDCSAADIIDGRTSGTRKHMRWSRSPLAAKNSCRLGWYMPGGLGRVAVCPKPLL